MEKTIVVAQDALFLEHRAPPGHPERPERLVAAEKALAAAVSADCVTVVPARDVTEAEVTRVHSERLLSSLARVDGRSGYLDEDTFVSPKSVAAARRAAGSVLSVVDDVLGDRSRFGVALVRPPGHHARPDTAMGFCLLNNVAIAAAHARSLGARRVAIVDWDVHHGNGTQEIFYDDPSVLYVSSHQFPFYPGTGNVDEAGSGDGAGFTVNVPLTAGADDAAYLEVYERVVAPILGEYAPDLLLISAGFDAHVQDPLASMRVSAAGFAELARILVRAVPRGAARTVLVLEGGYDLDGLSSSLQATIEALDGRGPKAPARGAKAPSVSEDTARAIAGASRYHRGLRPPTGVS